jgi:hypothetical protein
MGISHRGGLPDDLRASVAADGATLALLENLVVVVTFRNYRDAAGRYSSLRKQMVRGAIAITERTLIVYAGRFLHIRTPHQHPVRDGIEVTAERADRLCLVYDAGATNPSRKGRVELRLRTDRAVELAGLLHRLAEHD